MEDYLQKAAVDSLKSPGGAGKLPKVAGANLYIFRHCETYDNRRRIFSGRRNTRLTEKGEEQARRLAQGLKEYEIDVAYFPDLIRCKKTMEEVLRYHVSAKKLVEPLLLERDYGKLTGKSKMKAMREHPVEAIGWRRGYRQGPPGGESLACVEARVKPFCRRLEEAIKDENIKIAVCGTNNTMRMMRRYFEKLSVEQMQVLENPYGDWAAYRVS